MISAALPQTVDDCLQISLEIKRLAREAGFGLVGISSAADSMGHNLVPDPIASGRAGAKSRHPRSLLVK